MTRTSHNLPGFLVGNLKHSFNEKVKVRKLNSLAKDDNTVHLLIRWPCFQGLVK